MLARRTIAYLPIMKFALKSVPFSTMVRVYVYNTMQYNTIQYNTIQVYCVILLASGVALHEMTHQLVYSYSTLENYQRVRKSRETLKKLKKLSFRNRSKSSFFPGKLLRKTEKAYSGSVVVINTLIPGAPKLLVYGLFRK